MTTADSPRRADGWTAVVRQRLGLGRLLPLGGPDDGAWIAERAAVAVLREAVARSGAATGPGPVTGSGAASGSGAAPATGAVLGGLRLALADAERAPAAAVPGPPSALPPGPLRIEADFSATAERPLPATADVLRSALLAAASQRLGLVVAEVDLRVTELLDTAPEQPAVPVAEVRAAEPDGVAGAAAAGVPGVVSLTRVLGSAVHTGPGHIRIELATAGSHRALDVALAVRAAVAGAVEGSPQVAVLVSAVVDSPVPGEPPA